MDSATPDQAHRPDGRAVVPSGRVLLVEDDEDDVLLVCDLLEQWPELQVEVVPTIADAAARLSRGAIDCVLLDLGLPDAVGLEALERLLEVETQVAVVVLTGDVAEQRGIDALGAGAQDYLVKGRIDANTLTRAIRYAIERKHSERSRQELAVARAHQAENARLQRGLLPAPIVADPRITIAAAYRPGSRRSLLGGDFYDIVQDADGCVHAIVGDVCGHGPDEAALGVRLRMAWRTLILAGVAQDDLFPILDRILVHERERPALFVSLAQVSIDPGCCAARLRLAGHPPPILVTSAGARLLDECAPGPVLGVRGLRPSPVWDVDLGDGWTLMLYTDGLYEGYAGDGPDRLGLEGLLALVDPAAARNGDGTPGALISEVERRNGGALSDDVAVLTLACDSTAG